jgi:26S proteasome regulatory subunit N8
MHVNRAMPENMTISKNSKSDHQRVRDVEYYSVRGMPWPFHLGVSQSLLTNQSELPRRSLAARKGRRTSEPHQPQHQNTRHRQRPTPSTHKPPPHLCLPITPVANMPATTAETLSLVTRNVSVAPLVLLSAADHYGRQAKGTRKRVVGVLLGQNDGKNVRVSNSFAGELRPT